MLKEIKGKYIQESSNAKLLENELEEKISKKKEKIKKLNDDVKKLVEKKWDIQSPSWIDSLLKPMAEVLSKELNLKYDIYGPFGMRAQTTIYFMEDLAVSITEQDVKSITIIPGKLSEAELFYETGKLKPGVPANSNHINDPNGFNKEILPLPENIEDILTIINTKKED